MLDETFKNPEDVAPKARRTVIFAGDREAIESQISRGANWILWIVGISMVNTFCITFGIDFFFNIGLGITTVFDIVFRKIASEPDLSSKGRLVAMAINIVLDLAVFGAFLALWWLTVRRHYRWALMAAIVLFAADTLIFIPLQLWMAAAIHVVAIVFMWMGFAAFRNVKIERVLDYGTVAKTPA